MRIFFDHQIFSFQKFGGISRYFSQLFKQFLQEPEFDCQIVCPIRYNRNVYLKELPINPSMRQIETNSRYAALGYYWLNQQITRKIYRQADFDLMHPTFYHPYLLKHRRRPMITTIHDMTPEKFPEEFEGSLYGKLVSRPWIRAKKALALQSEAIITVSENTKKDVMEIYGIPAERITVIHLGYTPLISETSVAVSPVAKPYIMFVGARGGYKNFRLLIQAFGQLTKDQFEGQLLCVGGGAWTPDERKFLQDCQLEARVLQRSLTDDQLVAAYQNAEFFVYPSRYEGFGLPILEAFANSCPVLLSRSSCFPEIGGEAAHYFEPDSVDSLYSEMKYLLINNSLRENLKNAGQKRVQAFEWQLVAEKTSRLYRQVLN